MACFVQSDSFHAVDDVNLLLDSERTGSCAAVRPGPVQGYSRCACPDMGAKSMSDMMNKANYVEELYEYDRKLLEEFEAAVRQVAELQDQPTGKNWGVLSFTDIHQGNFS